MTTVSRWRSTRPARLRIEIVSLEVLMMGLMLFLAGLSDLPVGVFFALVAISTVAQSVLFYHIGRVREKLNR